MSVPTLSNVEHRCMLLAVSVGVITFRYTSFRGFIYSERNPRFQKKKKTRGTLKSKVFNTEFPLYNIYSYGNYYITTLSRSLFQVYSLHTC